jgi:hypothetical protein
MSGRLWLESVQIELVRRRLPRQEVARLVAELSDHLTDVMESRSTAGMVPARSTASDVYSSNLTEEPMSMDATAAGSLGSPSDIADVAEREYRRRKPFLSRSRLAAFCTFVLLPLPALLLSWAATFLLLVALAESLKWCGVRDPFTGHTATPAQQAAAYAFFLGLLLAPAAAVTWLFGRLARKTNHLWGWGLAACILLAVGTMAANVQLTFSPLPGKNTLMFGLGIGWSLLRLHHLAQFLIPLAVGIVTLRRSARQTQQVPGL